MNTILLIAILAVVIFIALRQKRGTALNPRLFEVNFMIRIPDDTPDGAISASLGTVTDAEGQPVECSLADPTSDNPDAFAFTDVSNSGQSLTAGYHVGAPGEAKIRFAAKRNDNGEEVGSQAFVVQVGTGAVTNVPLTVDLGTLHDDA